MLPKKVVYAILILSFLLVGASSLEDGNSSNANIQTTGEGSQDVVSNVPNILLGLGIIIAAQKIQKAKRTMWPIVR